MSVLSDLLMQHEGKTLEFKRDVSSPENLMKTIVAFANGAGGTMLIGVEDRTRRVLGIAEPTQTEERLANLISDRIEPRLQAGLPEPMLEELASGFRVTFSLRATQVAAEDPLDRAILEFVRRSKGASTRAIAAHIGRTTRSTRNRLARLVDLGLLAALGSGPRDPRRLFQVAR